jgi:hypothetical protein
MCHLRRATGAAAKAGKAVAGNNALLFQVLNNQSGSHACRSMFVRYIPANSKLHFDIEILGKAGQTPALDKEDL